MSTWPVFWRTPMSTHSFSSCSGTSSCVSTTIALFTSRAARAFQSSAAEAPWQTRSSARNARAVFFMADRLSRVESSELKLQATGPNRLALDSFEFPFRRSLEGGQSSCFDRAADRLHPLEVEKDVVDREEH